MKTSYLSTLFILLFSVACSETDSNSADNQDTKINISGIVLDAKTNTPIEGVEIAIAELELYTQTNSIGKFIFSECFPKKYTFIAKHPQYITTSVQVQCTNSDDDLITIKLTGNDVAWNVTPTLLDFGSNPDLNSISFSIQNNSTESGSWSVNTAATWISSIAPQSGALTAGESCSVKVDINRANVTKDTAPALLNITVAGKLISLYARVSSDGSSEGGDDKENGWNVVKNGLTAYYSFDEDTKNKVVDDMHGYTSGTSFVTGVCSGQQALNFSATSSMTIAEPMMDGKMTTVGFWIKDAYDGHIMSVHVDKGVLFDYTKAFYLELRNGVLRYIPTGRDLYVYYSSFTGFSTPSLIDGSWHYIVITTLYSTVSYDVEATLYVDGSKVDKQITKAYSEHAKFGAGIRYGLGGTCQNTSNQSISGASMEIDNLRFYGGRCLTADEIKQIYNAEK